MDNPSVRRSTSLEGSSGPPLPIAPPAPPANGLEPVAEEQAHVPVRSVVKDLLETAIFILLVFFIMRGMVQNFKIEGSSMEPNLHNGQYILVNKLIYFHFDINAPLRLLPGMEEIERRIIYPFRPPHRGDIIVFEYPRDVSKDYIKRVIALPGDIVEFNGNGQVSVNGQPLNETYLQGVPTYCNPGSICADGPVVVPSGTIFVMGDNRTNSSDSREWSALPLDRVIGQAWLLYYPVKDWGIVPHYSFAAQP